MRLRRGLDVDDHSELHIDEIIVGVGEKRQFSHRAVHWAAGSDGETNFGCDLAGLEHCSRCPESGLGQDGVAARLSAERSPSELVRATADLVACERNGREGLLSPISKNRTDRSTLSSLFPYY